MRPRLADSAGVVRENAGIRTELPCFLLRGVFSRAECAGLIADAEAAGFRATGGDYPPSYRDNDRRVHDDAALAEAVFARIRACLPERLVDGAGGAWRLRGLNPRFRFCRYRHGQRFCIHRDGAYAPEPGVRSRLTCMLYLNDGAEFSGGGTRYYAERFAGSALLGRVRPEAGTLIVFDHELWHDGEAVTAGTKYVLRTDVLYDAEDRTHDDTAEALTGHRGYVWHVLARRGGGLATASRDGTVRLWRPEADTWREDGVLTGHTASVVALAEDARGRLWSASRDRAVRRWEDGGGQIIGHHEGAVLCLAALADGSVASGGADGVIRLWSPEGACQGVLRGHTGWIWALVPLEEGLLASASEDGTVRLWRVASQEASGPPVRLESPVRALAALPHGGLVSGQATGELTAWRLTRAPHPALVPQGSHRVHRGAVCALAALSEGLVASGGEDDALQFTRLPDFTPVAAAAHADFVRSLAVLPGGRLASASYDATVRLWPVPLALSPPHPSGDGVGPCSSASSSSPSWVSARPPSPPSPSFSSP